MAFGSFSFFYFLLASDLYRFLHLCIGRGVGKAKKSKPETYRNPGRLTTGIRQNNRSMKIGFIFLKVFADKKINAANIFSAISNDEHHKLFVKRSFPLFQLDVVGELFVDLKTQLGCIHRKTLKSYVLFEQGYSVLLSDPCNFAARRKSQKAKGLVFLRAHRCASSIEHSNCRVDCKINPVPFSQGGVALTTNEVLKKTSTNCSRTYGIGISGKILMTRKFWKSGFSPKIKPSRHSSST